MTSGRFFRGAADRSPCLWRKAVQLLAGKRPPWRKGPFKNPQNKRLLRRLKRLLCQLGESTMSSVDDEEPDMVREQSLPGRRPPEVEPDTAVLDESVYASSRTLQKARLTLGHLPLNR